MAVLTFNMQGYAFQEGIRVLIAAHETTADAIHEELQRAKEDALAYQEEVERGEREWIGERDEDGHVIWDQEQVHDMEIKSKIEGQAAVRKAFVIPANYVTTRYGIDYVSIRQGDRTISAPVQRGRHLASPELPDGLEILSGIRPGDQLVQP